MSQTGINKPTKALKQWRVRRDQTKRGRARRTANSIIAIFLCTAICNGCGSNTADKPAPPRIKQTSGTAAGGPVSSGGKYKLGRPYTINGITYVPKHEPDYDRVGLASIYSSRFHLRRTANGERYDKNRLSGAHPTLPLPSYVMVTNLENGIARVVRLNDRGPFIPGRIIDLSQRAAQELNFVSQGLAKVRVQYLGPAPL